MGDFNIPRNTMSDSFKKAVLETNINFQKGIDILNKEYNDVLMPTLQRVLEPLVVRDVV